MDLQPEPHPNLKPRPGGLALGLAVQPRALPAEPGSGWLPLVSRTPAGSVTGPDSPCHLQHPQLVLVRRHMLPCESHTRGEVEKALAAPGPEYTQLVPAQCQAVQNMEKEPVRAVTV